METPFEAGGGLVIQKGASTWYLGSWWKLRVWRKVGNDCRDRGEYSVRAVLVAVAVS